MFFYLRIDSDRRADQIELGRLHSRVQELETTCAQLEGHNAQFQTRIRAVEEQNRALEESYLELHSLQMETQQPPAWTTSSSVPMNVPTQWPQQGLQRQSGMAPPS